MPDLYRVLKGKHLHFPDYIAKQKLWLGEGGIVDLEVPEVLRAVEGQEYKLEPVPPPGKGRRWPDPDPITETNLKRLIEKTVTPKPTEVVAEKLTETGSKHTGGIPEPDALPLEAS